MLFDNMGVPILEAFLNNFVPGRAIAYKSRLNCPSPIIRTKLNRVPDDIQILFITNIQIHLFILATIFEISNMFIKCAQLIKHNFRKVFSII